MLSAFMSLGVHIPKDVRFVCSSNGGFRPQAYGSVAAIEFDPYGRGGEVAKRIFSWLTERRPFPVSALEATYVDGSTFP